MASPNFFNELGQGERVAYERILVYADPKSGKSRFVTSLPEEWGEIVYFAIDQNSQGMNSTLAKYRGRIHVKSMRKGKKGPDGIGPIQSAMAIPMTDWKAKHPKMGVLVLDTVSTIGEQFLAQIADEGQFSKNHIKVDLGNGEQMSIPMEGDYGAAQRAMSRFFDLFEDKPYHLIVVAHSVLAKDKEGNIIGGGPKTVGSATVGSLPGLFNPVVYLKTRNLPGIGGKPPAVEFKAYTIPQGHFTAGIRESHDGGNSLAQVVLESDPVHFWTEFENHYR